MRTFSLPPLEAEEVSDIGIIDGENGANNPDVTFLEPNHANTSQAFLNSTAPSQNHPLIIAPRNQQVHAAPPAHIAATVFPLASEINQNLMTSPYFSSNENGRATPSKNAPISKPSVSTSVSVSTTQIQDLTASGTRPPTRSYRPDDSAITEIDPYEMECSFMEISPPPSARETERLATGHNKRGKGKAKAKDAPLGDVLEILSDSDLGYDGGDMDIELLDDLDRIEREATKISDPISPRDQRAQGRIKPPTQQNRGSEARSMEKQSTFDMNSRSREKGRSSRAIKIPFMDVITINDNPPEVITIDDETDIEDVTNQTRRNVKRKLDTIGGGAKPLPSQGARNSQSNRTSRPVILAERSADIIDLSDG